MHTDLTVTIWRTHQGPWKGSNNWLNANRSFGIYAAFFCGCSRYSVAILNADPVGLCWGFVNSILIALSLASPWLSFCHLFSLAYWFKLINYVNFISPHFILIHQFNMIILKLILQKLRLFCMEIYLLVQYDTTTDILHSMGMYFFIWDC